MNEDVRGVFAQALDDDLPPVPKADTDDLVAAGRRAVTRRRSMLSGGSVAAAVAVLALAGAVLQHGPGGGNIAANPSASSVDDPGVDPGGLLRQATIDAFTRYVPGVRLTQEFAYQQDYTGDLSASSGFTVAPSDRTNSTQIWITPIGEDLADANAELEKTQADCTGYLACTITDGPEGQHVLTKTWTGPPNGESIDVDVYAARADGTVAHLWVGTSQVGGSQAGAVSGDQAASILLAVPLQAPGTLAEPWTPDDSADPDGALLASVRQAVETVLPGAKLSGNPYQPGSEPRVGEGPSQGGKELMAKLTLADGTEATFLYTRNTFNPEYGTDSRKQLEMHSRCAGAEGTCTFAQEENGEWLVTRPGPDPADLDLMGALTRPDDTIVKLATGPWGTHATGTTPVSMEQLTAILRLLP